MKKRYNLFILSINLILLGGIFPSCIKEKEGMLPQDKAMRFLLEAFYTDTSLFQTVELDNTVVVNQAVISPGNFNILYQSPLGGLFSKDSTKLRVTVVKKSNPNLTFDSTIYLTNINEFLLMQLDPKKAPQFINKKLENATAIKPGKDSVKVRFYFSSDDDFRSKIPGNPQASILQLKLYMAERQPDGSYQKNNTLIQTINNIKVNQLSTYYTLSAIDGQEYLFDLFDARTGNYTESQRLIQHYSFDPDFFVDSYIGRVERQGTLEGLFQTCRLTRTVNNNGMSGINALFLFGLD